MNSTFYYYSRYLRTKFILSCIFLLYSLLSTKSGRIFPLDEEGNLQCNPRTKHLFGRFILQRFFDARQELGMENLRVKYAQNPSEFADIAEYVLVRLFSFTPGAQVYYRQNRDPIIYVRIWKCANEGIMNNLLQVISDPETHLKGALVHEAMTVGSLRETLHAMHRKEFLSSTAVNIFTFVREPFSKFISGFTESVFRTNPSFTLRQSSEPGMVLNYTFTKTIIERVLDCEIPIAHMTHFFPLSGALFAYPFRAVGHLESFKMDWDSMIRPLYGISAEYNSTLGDHPTSEIHPQRKTGFDRSYSSTDKFSAMTVSKGTAADPDHVRAILRELFAKEVKYKRAICHFLLIDYVCLPEYPLPEDCLFLNDTLHRAREALHRRQEIPAS